MRTLLILIALLCASARGEPPALDVGRAFPNLALPALEPAGTTLSVGQFRGQKIVLHIFASW